MWSPILCSRAGDLRSSVAKSGRGGGAATGDLGRAGGGGARCHEGGRGQRTPLEASWAALELYWARAGLLTGRRLAPGGARIAHRPRRLARIPALIRIVQ